MGLAGCGGGLVSGFGLIGDKNYFGADFQAQLGQTRAVELRPARKGEPDLAGSSLL